MDDCCDSNSWQRNHFQQISTNSLTSINSYGIEEKARNERTTNRKSISRPIMNDSSLSTHNDSFNELNNLQNFLNIRLSHINPIDNDDDTDDGKSLGKLIFQKNQDKRKHKLNFSIDSTSSSSTNSSNCTRCRKKIGRADDDLPMVKSSIRQQFPTNVLSPSLLNLTKSAISDIRTSNKSLNRSLPKTKRRSTKTTCKNSPHLKNLPLFSNKHDLELSEKLQRDRKVSHTLNFQNEIENDISLMGYGSPSFYLPSISNTSTVYNSPQNEREWRNGSLQIPILPPENYQNPTTLLGNINIFSSLSPITSSSFTNSSLSTMASSTENNYGRRSSKFQNRNDGHDTDTTMPFSSRKSTLPTQTRQLGRKHKEKLIHHGDLSLLDKAIQIGNSTPSDYTSPLHDSIEKTTNGDFPTEKIQLLNSNRDPWLISTAMFL
ncbi:hypothetical protein SNEBB_006537 [Seison nebaliae]|nr:hypothetical protein SNEBB_006537 [Seison nebaliae]